MSDFLSNEPFSPMAIRFGEYIARVAGSESTGVRLAAELAAQRISEGDVCVDLAEAAGRAVMKGLAAPELSAWEEELRASRVVGAPGEYRPLILDGSHRLYLARYWEYERRVADSLIARSAATRHVDPTLLAKDLGRLFPPDGAGGTDWQRVAAETAVKRRFCVISGGPGTGKTTTVVRILAALLSQVEGRPFEIALAAPTGKAAARMQDVLAAAKAGLNVDASVLARIPERAGTLHRLLGVQPESTRTRYGRENPLAADVVVVDEASMVDLALMAKLCDALRPDASLILLGDKDQLASVEAGSVLGDICAGGESGPLAASIVLLRKNYRFDEASGIGRVSALVNAGDAAAALAALGAGGSGDIIWNGRPAAEAVEDLRQRAVEGYAPYLRAIHDGIEPAKIIETFGGFRVLCAHRLGPAGVEGLNRSIESALGSAGLIRKRGIWYAGRPVMITENDYNLRLFNGDIGIAIPEGSAMRVYFAGTSGRLRGFAPGRLPEHEDVFASTVHKSQGSEFDDVLLVLPGEATRVMTRELLYTALTRARRRVEVWGTEDVLEKGVSRRLERSSGLRERLMRRRR